MIGVADALDEVPRGRSFEPRGDVPGVDVMEVSLEVPLGLDADRRVFRLIRQLATRGAAHSTRAPRELLRVFHE